MGGTKAQKTPAPADTSLQATVARLPEREIGRAGSMRQLVTVALLLALGLGGLSLLSDRPGELAVFATIVLLALLGAFFLFAVAAGHIRFGERDDAQMLLSRLAEETGVALQVNAVDGTQLYANAQFDTLVDGSGEAGSLEALLASDPDSAECLFRLTRAAERGERHAEEIVMRGGVPRSRQARFLRLAVAPLTVPGYADELQPFTLWRVHDISGERARENEMRRGFETALARYDTMPAGVLTTDGDGKTVRTNATLLDWLGAASASKRDTLDLDDVFAGDGASLLRATTRQRRGETVALDLDLHANDGVRRPVRVIARMVAAAERTGEITAVVQATDAGTGLNSPSADSQFARFFHAAPFGIATIGATGDILQANAAFARMFLDGARDVRALPDMFAGDQAARKAIEAALAEVKAGRAVTAPIEIAGGAKREFTRRIYVSPPARSGEGGERAVLYVVDATEQKELERRVAQIQKMDSIGELAGGIAHDFNNVLTAIIGFSDLLLDKRRPTDPAYPDLMHIKTNANRAAGMVKQLLAFARQQTLNQAVHSLNEVISDFSLMLRSYITEKVELKSHLERDLWLVKADKGQFEQVLMNLALNSRDAMPAGGALTITTRNITERESAKLGHVDLSPGEYVMCELSDTGTGMPADVLAKIFEPFFTTKDVGKGTGLGLAQVHGIVRQTGGAIIPESTPGHGTTFRIYLPRYVPSQAEVAKALAEKERKPESRDLTGSGRVLLVEDEDAVRNFAARALRRQGYEVLEATSGVEALEVFAKADGRVDLVVSDVIMPEMDGPTLLKVLRKTRPDMKIIFVSGYPDDAFKDALDAGTQFAFLPKPFTLPQLAARVKEEMAR